MRLDFMLGVGALTLAVVGALGGWWVYAAILGSYALVSFARAAFPRKRHGSEENPC